MFLRTDEFRFKSLKDYDFKPNFVDIFDNKIGSIRQHYLDEGSKNSPLIVLLHGEPSWSYLYRHMVKILIGQHFRVLVPDLIGFGKSDKPGQRSFYSYSNHVNWLTQFLIKLRVKDAVLFGQDWGGLIGLRIVAQSPFIFGKIMIGNTFFPTGLDFLGDKFYAWRNYSQKSETFCIGNIVHKGTVSGLDAQEIEDTDGDQDFNDELQALLTAAENSA